MVPPPRRRARRGASGAAVALVALVAWADPAAAHSVEGGALPAPPWLLSYVGIAVVAITAFALRTSWPTPRLRRLDDPPTEPAAEEPRLGPGNGLGLVLLAAVLVAAVVGPDSAAANIAPVAVLVVWWVGLPLLCLLAGDVMRAINPFQPVAAALGRDRLADRAAPPPVAAWSGAAFLFAFSWFFLAYHRPGSPRALAVFLAVYVVVALVGAWRWGRTWLATGEGFGALSAAVARIALRRPRHPAPPGVAALMVVWIGGTAFDGFANTPFWADILGSSQGWTRTLVNTVGLVWLTAIVAALYLVVVRVAERLAARRAAAEADVEAETAAPGAPPPAWPQLGGVLGVALVPLATGWFLAHDLTLLLAEGQNFLALISDPLGRGWDLFGTIGNTIDYTLFQATWVGWLQLGGIVVGHLASLVVLHDLVLRRLRRRDAVTVTWTMAAVTAASLTAAALLVLT
jgi:hypothetical protein